MLKPNRYLAMRIAFAAFAISAAGAAQAASYLITYSGQVTSGNDATAEFGSVQSLAGAAFTANYLLTIPTAGALIDTDGVTYKTISGGANFGTDTPLTGSLTINGVTKAVSGNLAGSAGQYNNFAGSLDIVSHIVNEGFSDAGASGAKIINLGVGSFTNNIVNSIDFAEGVNYVIQPGDFATGNFRFFATHLVDNGSFFEVVYDDDAYGELLVQSLSISSLSGVPEISSWAMMLAGFGLIGGAFRQRSLRATYAASGRLKSLPAG